jgi:phospholipid/cholesterol/gamma-HCH transport system substrate-binding protein
VDADESFEVTAEFNDVLNLVPRSPVLVNDVTVGEVVSLERVGWHAGAVLRIQDDVVLPENTIAQIEQSSLLGEKYVALRPGPGPAVGQLEDGDNIPLAATGRNPELEEVLGSLSFLLNGGGVGQLKTITTELNAVFDGRQDRLRHVLGEMSTLVAGLDAQKDDIIAAMEALNGLTGTLNREKATVTEALDTLGPAVTVLADQHDQLISMLKALDRLGAVGTRVIGETKDQILEDLARLRPVLHEIVAAGDQLPTALSLLISFPFPIESNDIVYGDYANTSIFFNLNLRNLPTGLDALGLNLGKGAAATGERTVGDVLSQMPGLPGLPGGDPAESAGDLASLMGGAE